MSRALSRADEAEINEQSVTDQIVWRAIFVTHNEHAEIDKKVEKAFEKRFADSKKADPNHMNPNTLEVSKPLLRAYNDKILQKWADDFWNSKQLLQSYSGLTMTGKSMFRAWVHNLAPDGEHPVDVLVWSDMLSKRETLDVTDIHEHSGQHWGMVVVAEIRQEALELVEKTKMLVRERLTFLKGTFQSDLDKSMPQDLMNIVGEYYTTSIDQKQDPLPRIKIQGKSERASSKTKSKSKFRVWKILNPETGRYVNKSGILGQKLMAAQKLQ